MPLLGSQRLVDEIRELEVNDLNRPDAPHALARWSGLIYAVVVVTGIFSLSFAPDRVFAGENDAEIVHSLVANADLLKLSIALEVVCYVAFLILPLTLYALLAPAGRISAMMMVALACMSVPLGFAGLVHLLDIVRWLDGGAAQMDQAAIMSALNSYWSGMRLLAIPWGLWLIPFGWLVIRSRYTPSVLGGLLILGGVGYVANFLGGLLVPNYADLGIASILKAPRLSEILICLWLLIMGARGLSRSRQLPAAIIADASDRGGSDETR